MTDCDSGQQHYTVDVVDAAKLHVQLKQQIRQLHRRCFPGEDDPSDSLDNAFEQICFLHDAADCTWFLLWLPDGGGAAGNGSSSPPSFPRRLVGMCAGVQYHDSFYCFAFGVDPAFRRQGYGKRILFGVEVWVLERGLPLKICATVDAQQTRLIAFYQSQGAVIESNGITSPNAPPPPSVRMVKHFDEAEARRQLGAAEAEIKRASARRRRQLPVSLIVVFVAVAVVYVSAVMRQRHSA